ncbi:holo-ACP synthase [Kutzneria kofuensis]|uniref:holo-ACP synthase n=1 Tax=Kutzneria kofuensis TaxID=103725 RepID=UPI00160C477F|nr:4'-phosphopantetheinyl transferase superfamily protein [Kutzneria kofuensis]
MRGIGVDLADLRRMSRWRTRFPADVLGKVFTSGELAEVDSHPHPAVRMGVSVAGKEACGKALGRGLVGMAWTDIAVRAGPAGALRLELSGAAAAHAWRAGVRGWTGCWSHLADRALVLVRVIAWNTRRGEPLWQDMSTTRSSSRRPSS